MRIQEALCVVVVSCVVTLQRVSAAPQTVYITNQSPSHLYINTATGSAQVSSKGYNGSSDIIQLVLYPADAQSVSPQQAIVLLQGSISGLLRLVQPNPPVGPTYIQGTIIGLTPGLHGFHIHQTGNLTEGCKSTGGHYNPFQRDHGSPQSHIRHVGDLGNIFADATGTSIVNIGDNQVTLVGPNSVIGRAVVVHAAADDLGLGGNHGSRTTGNAGGRVGCGVIGRA